MTATGLETLPPIGPAAVTFGVFDGVHLGHRQLVDATVRAARERAAAAVAIVFSPHPDEVIRPGTRVPRLLPPELTIDRLVRSGMDHVVEVRFDDGVRNLTPEEFLGALAPAIELRALTMTPESAFGRKREGTMARASEIGATVGFDVIAVDPLVIDGDPISSSRIRVALASGAVDHATRLMGAPPTLRGTVVTGDRRGRSLGFPTANLRFDYVPALPALGIYLGRVSVPERGVAPGHPALVSVGVRPTFHEHGGVLVEVYLLDWDGDLYGAELNVDLESRLREERRFESVDDLVAQMRSDEDQARALIGA